MSARTETYALMQRLGSRGINATFEQANTLRRASKTLSSWAEKECGSDRGCVERDEETKRTYWLNASTGQRTPCLDLETGALARVMNVCAELGVWYYHQADPRGCALYVSAEPLSDSDYNRGVAVY